MTLLKTENKTLATIGAVLVVILISVAIAFNSVFNAVIDRYLLIGAILSLFACLLVFHKYQWGIFMAFTLSIFMAFVKRMLYSEIPLGVAYDGLIVLAFFSLLIGTTQRKLDWRMFGNWITYSYLMLTALYLIEIINPEGVLTAWIVSLRFHVFFLMYVVCFHLVSTFRSLQKVTLFWIGLALIVGLYGIYQEMFGFTDFEWDFIYSTPERYALYFTWGHMRKFSLLADPSVYGMLMAFSSLSCIVLALSLSKWIHKIAFGTMAMIMLYAMISSGTRTGYAMVAVGLFFYVVITLRSRRTIIIALVFSAVGLGLFFGPFYGWQMNRIRSTFTPSDDASMDVREEKRIQFQPYIRAHPIGAGIYTTAFNGQNYAPGHFLAGFDPDGGYLEVALETGWIGLILFLLLVGATVLRGIKNYFSIRDPMVKIAILVYLVPFFALSVAQIAQSAMFSKPLDFLVVMTLGLMARAPQLSTGRKEKRLSHK